MEKDMKEKRQTAVKQHQAQVEQEMKKVHTFVCPLTENVNEVSLAGDFNNWKPVPMTKSGKGFHATVKLDSGLYQYKFVVDGQWQEDPYAKGKMQNNFGATNSVLLVD